MTPGSFLEVHGSRSVAWLLFALAVCAHPVAAQRLPAGIDAEVRLSPLVGYTPAFRRVELREILLAGQVRGREFETEFASGTAAGAALEVGWIEPFRITTAAVVVSRGAGVTTALASSDESDRPGQLFLLARAGLAARLHESDPAEQIYPLNLAIFAAPAYVLEIPDRDPVTNTRERPLGSLAVSWGVDGEAPVGDRVGIHFGIEDWIVLWNRAELERRARAELAAAGADVRSVVYPAASHMWLLRAGLSLRF